MPDQATPDVVATEEAPPGALLHESFQPEQASVVTPDAEPGHPPLLLLQMFAGQVAPGKFMFCRQATLTPDFAIGLGQYLVNEGRKAKTGLVIPGTAVPADLK